MDGKWMNLKVPKDINLVLRRYALEAMEEGKNNREDAVIFIITKFLKELYKK